jgi:hypothetical protein
MTGPRPIILEGPAEQDNSSDRARHEEPPSAPEHSDSLAGRIRPRAEVTTS